MLPRLLACLALLVSFIAAPLARAQTPVVVSIDAQADKRPISPFIYGASWMKAENIAELNFTMNRAGGEVESNYNWRDNAHNICKNWYWISMSTHSRPEPAAATHDHITATRTAPQGEAAITVPMQKWVPKLGPNRSSTWSFSIAKYGAQTGHEPYGSPDAGNGIRPDGTNITGNDPNDAYFLTDSRFQKDFVSTVTNRWGLSTDGGVRHYIMDNEYGLWDYIHRDIHPEADITTKEEIRDLLFDYAGRVKAIDPGSKIWAPEEWGFLEFGYIPWLLDQMRRHEEATGVRLLDICTVHHYCSESGSAVDTATQLARNISTRQLWDPQWVDPAVTWYNKPHYLIPTMKKWVNENYPGTQIGITEYNWGAHEHINGATAQADVLGIFGREGLDVATYWGDAQNKPNSPVFKAMKLYRNYDGNRSTFGETSIRTTVPQPDELSAFASLRASDGAMTIMVINKQLTTAQPVELSLANYFHGGTAQVWQLTAANTITRLADLTFTGNRPATTVPQQSITLFVIPPGAPVTAGAAASPSPAHLATSVSTLPTLQWQPGANALTHDVYLGTSSSAVAAATPASPEFKGNLSTTSFTPSAPLAANTVHYWRIDERANASATPGTVWRFTTGAAPASPTGLAAAGSSVWASDARLTWNTVSGATSYRLKRATTPAGPFVTVASPTSAAFTDTALFSGTTYYYLVSAIGTGGESTHSALLAVTTRQNLASGKTATASSAHGSNSAALAIDGIANTRWESAFSDPQWISLDLGTVCQIDAVRLNWESASSKAFRIEVSLDGTTWTTAYSTSTGSGGVALLTLSTPATGRHLRLTGTQRNTVYGHSLWEFEVYGTPQPPTVGQATGPLPAPADTQVKRSPGLSWFAGENALLHRVYFGTNATAVAAATPASPEYLGTSAFRDADVGELTPLTTYHWRIDQVNGTTVTPGEVWSFTTGDVINSPTSLSASEIWDSQARLAWSAVADATSYNLKRATALAGPYVTVANVTTLNVTDTSLSGGLTYYYVVSALGNGGESVNSTPLAVTTRINLARNPAATATASSTQGSNSPARAIDGNTGTRWESAFSDPQWLRIDLGNPFTIETFRLRWEAASSKSYKIEVSLDGTTWTTAYSTTTGPGGTETHTLATPLQARYVRLTGTQRNLTYGHSLWEFEVFTAAQVVIPDAPAAPSALRASALSRDTIALSWTDNSANETGFRIDSAEFPAGPFTTLANLGPDLAAYTHTGLAPGQTRFYRVLAFNGSIFSQPTPTATETTFHLPAAAPLEPAYTFQRLKHGLFVHYVYGGEFGNLTALAYNGRYPTSIDQLVNSFNVNTFADQVASMGVEFLIITAFHANMNVLYPSPKMVQWRGAGHSTTTRDLLGEIIDALDARGIRTMFYVHLSVGHDFHPATGGPYYPTTGGTITQDQINTGFYPAATTSDKTVWNNYMNDIFGEMAQRYGTRLAGFWCDGAYNSTTDLARLKATVRAHNSDLIFIGNNTASFGDFDLGAKECSEIANDAYSMDADAPTGFPPVKADVSTWVGYERQIALIAGGYWWSSPWEINSARFSAADVYRYTVLQAGANTDGGGVAWSAGCFGNGTFDPSFLNMMTGAYAHLAPIEESIVSTTPSASFPTPNHVSITRLAGGFTATRSPDGRTDYIHVLRPPTGNTLQLPPTADYRSFTFAELLPSKAPVTLTPNAHGTLLTLPVGHTWGALNTTIALHTTGPLPVVNRRAPVADTRLLNLGGQTPAGASDTLGVYQGRDRTLLRFDLTDIPPGSTIHAATLQLSAHAGYHTNTAGDPVEVYRLTQPWNELDALWAKRTATDFWTSPGGDAVGTSSLPLAAPYATNPTDPEPNAALTWDVSTLTQTWVSGTAPNHGLLLALGGTRTANLHFWSREQSNSGLRPFLSLTYTPAPSPLETWRQTWYGRLDNAGNAADNATPHAHGLANLLVFGLIGPAQNPATASPAQLPSLQLVSGTYRYDFTEPAGVSGITYAAEWSPSLAPNSWQPVPDLGTGTRHIFEAPRDQPRWFLRLLLSPVE